MKKRKLFCIVEEAFGSESLSRVFTGEVPAHVRLCEHRDGGEGAPQAMMGKGLF